MIGSWPNSNLVHEGALLSFAASQQDNARSRLRSAIDWTVAWVNAPREEHDRHGVDAGDVADIAIGLLNVNGAAACIEILQRWRPPAAPLKPAAIIASRLAQHGRLADISALLSQHDAGEYLLAGVASAAAQAGLVPEPPAIERCVVMLHARTEALAAPSSSFVERDDPDVTLAVCWIVALGVRYRQLSASEAERISHAVLAGRPARVSRVGTAAGQQHDHQGTRTAVPGARRAAHSLWPGWVSAASPPTCCGG